jgi:hypothetical protein
VSSWAHSVGHFAPQGIDLVGRPFAATSGACQMAVRSAKSMLFRVRLACQKRSLARVRGQLDRVALPTFAVHGSSRQRGGPFRHRSAPRHSQREHPAPPTCYHFLTRSGRRTGRVHWPDACLAKMPQASRSGAELRIILMIDLDYSNDRFGLF